MGIQKNIRREVLDSDAVINVLQWFYVYITLRVDSYVISNYRP